MPTSLFDKKRSLNFVDAVFSIALTVLILDIDIPTATEIKSIGAWNALVNLQPDFIGFIVSFFVISLHWVVNLRVSQRDFEMNKLLLRLHLFFLFSVVLLPFSTAFYVNGFDFKLPFYFYCGNLALIGFFQMLIIHKVFAQISGVEEEAKEEKMKVWITFIMYVLIGLASIRFPFYARFGFLLIFISQTIVLRVLRKRKQKKAVPPPAKKKRVVKGKKRGKR